VNDRQAGPIDFNPLDAERAGHSRRRQVEAHRVGFEEGNRAPVGRDFHPLERGGEREQVVAEPAGLEMNATAGERHLGPRQRARPDERQVNRDDDEDADGRECKRGREDPPAPAARQTPRIDRRRDCTADRSGALGASFRNISKCFAT
jgi:hypothetical protein